MSDLAQIIQQNTSRNLNFGQRLESQARTLSNIRRNKISSVLGVKAAQQRDRAQDQQDTALALQVRGKDQYDRMLEMQEEAGTRADLQAQYAAEAAKRQQQEFIDQKAAGVLAVVQGLRIPVEQKAGIIEKNGGKITAGEDGPILVLPEGISDSMADKMRAEFDVYKTKLNSLNETALRMLADPTTVGILNQATLTNGMFGDNLTKYMDQASTAQRKQYLKIFMDILEAQEALSQQNASQEAQVEQDKASSRVLGKALGIEQSDELFGKDITDRALGGRGNNIIINTGEQKPPIRTTSVKSNILDKDAVEAELKDTYDKADIDKYYSGILLPLANTISALDSSGFKLDSTTDVYSNLLGEFSQKWDADTMASFFGKKVKGEDKIKLAKDLIGIQESINKSKMTGVQKRYYTAITRTLMDAIKTGDARLYGYTLDKLSGLLMRTDNGSK